MLRSVLPGSPSSSTPQVTCFFFLLFNFIFSCTIGVPFASQLCRRNVIQLRLSSASIPLKFEECTIMRNEPEAEGQGCSKLLSPSFSFTSDLVLSVMFRLLSSHKYLFVLFPLCRFKIYRCTSA